MTSINVFRAAFLSIVLTLAAGPNAALWCGVWCHSGEGMAGACEYRTETGSPIVVTNADCDISNSATVFVRDDARRSTSAPHVEDAVLAPRFAFRPPAANTLSGYELDNRLLLEQRPLVLSLRI